MSSELVPPVQAIFNKQRVDKFLCVLNIPEGLKKLNVIKNRSNSSFNLDSLQFSVWGALTPEFSIPAVEARYGGNTLHISSHARPSWPPIKVNFTIDNQFNNYWVIWQWLNLLRDEKEGEFGIADKGQLLNKNSPLPEYSTTINIYAIDEYDNPIIGWAYEYAFPTKLDEIKWSERDTSEAQCGFTFVFGRTKTTLITE